VRSGDGIGAAERKLLQNIILERAAGNGYGREDRQRDPYPLAVEEKEQFVVNDRTAETTSKVVYRGTRLVIARSCIGKVIGRIEDRAVP